MDRPKTAEALFAMLAALPSLERARAVHWLLTEGRADLAAIRRGAIAEEVTARRRGGVNQVAAELGVSRQKVSEALTEHARSVTSDIASP